MEKNDRVEFLLALILLGQNKSAPMREKIILLNLAGFSNVEIADILQTTSNFVAKTLSENKKKRISSIRTT